MVVLAVAVVILSTSVAVVCIHKDNCRPAEITDTDDAGCGRWLPRYHPKNAMPLAHNNDANAPFEFNGVHHLFMQANFPGVLDWNGAIGLGHVASTDLATWRVLSPALVPGRYKGPPGSVGQQAGEATGGYYSGSATLVHGVPRIVIPAVFGEAGAACPGACSNANPWFCMLNRTMLEKCAMLYTVSSPTDLKDPWLENWSAPVTVVDGRTDGAQPHGPGFDDVTHAWQDAEDLADGKDTWRFAGQTTVCATPACNRSALGDQPEYLQLFASNNGSDWSKGFTSLGNLFPKIPDGLSDAGILNVPDFWKKEETAFPLDFVHFGDGSYWLGNYTRLGPGVGQTTFVLVTPRQQFGPGAVEGHGYYSHSLQKFVWWGWIGGTPPVEEGVPRWDSSLSVARIAEYDAGLSTVGDFHGMIKFSPAAALDNLRSQLLYENSDAWVKEVSGELWLQSAEGNCIDLELNVTWPNGSVPTEFGSVGLKVLGSIAGGGYEILISSGVGGSFSMNGVPLAPANSIRPRPDMLSLRVLVDRSVIESFGQGGRASLALSTYVTTNSTALVWRPSPASSITPVFSLRVWRMRTGFDQSDAMHKIEQPNDRFKVLTV